MHKALQLFNNLGTKGLELLLLVEKLEDPVEQERRHNICQSNADSCYLAETDQCSQCSCFMKIKTGMLKHRNPRSLGRIEVTHCPLSKWGGAEELPIVNHYRQLDGKEPLKLD